MRKLKLRGADRYSVLSIQHEPIERGETLEVEDDVAEKLLKETVPDAANRRWPIWEDVTPEEEASAEKVVRKTTKRRRRRVTEKTVHVAAE